MYLFEKSHGGTVVVAARIESQVLGVIMKYGTANLKTNARYIVVMCVTQD